MFFWFTSDNFTIIDALTKLILVITGSALIICFCHKLTNYKKSRRFKSNCQFNSDRHQQQQHESARHLGGPLINHQRGLGPSPPRCQPPAPSIIPDPLINNHHLLAYDPYNSTRPFNCLNLDLAPHTTQLVGPYGFQSPFVPCVAHIEDLATFANQPQQSPNNLAEAANTTNLNESTSSTNNQTTTNLIANPIYSTGNNNITTGQADFSTFQAQLIQNQRQQHPEDHDQCPSYEEAIASSGFQPPAVAEATTEATIENSHQEMPS